MLKLTDRFHKLAVKTAEISGTPWAFSVALLLITVWAIRGPIFRFSDTWQLVINTGTTIMTFLMVFLIQNTQNRDAQAIHLKLDELILSKKGARNTLIDLENLSEEELQKLKDEFARMREISEEIQNRRQLAVQQELEERRQGQGT